MTRRELALETAEFCIFITICLFLFMAAFSGTAAFLLENAGLPAWPVWGT